MGKRSLRVAADVELSVTEGDPERPVVEGRPELPRPDLVPVEVVLADEGVKEISTDVRLIREPSRRAHDVDRMCPRRHAARLIEPHSESEPPPQASLRAVRLDEDSAAWARLSRVGRHIPDSEDPKAFAATPLTKSWPGEPN